MEENDATFLKHCKLNIEKTGKWMNIFSILMVVAILLLAVGGLFLIYYSGTLPDDMPHYLDNILGILGIGLIIICALLVPLVVLTRRAVHAAEVLKVNADLSPIRAFVHANRDVWHYSFIILLVVLGLAAVFGIILYVYLLPTLSTL